MKQKTPLNPLFLSLRRCSAGVAIAYLFANTATAAGTLSTLLQQIQSAPQNSWVQVKSANQFPMNSIIPPVSVPIADENPSYGNNPAAIIYAWSSFAWDPNRGDLIIWGGGHANYSGNEVYRWRGATQTWERDSLPSYIQNSQNYYKSNPGAVYIPYGDVASPFDGAMYAPTPSHTYDNQLYLPVADRFITFGGAAFQTGGQFLKQIANGLYQTGPYLFNPALADSTKVGGVTGSGVDPSVLGGHMWENRDIYFDNNGNPKNSSALNEVGEELISGTIPIPYPNAGSKYINGTAFGHVNGTTDYAFKNGQEVIYLTGGAPGGGTDENLFSLTIANYSNPALDKFILLGTNWNGTGGQGAGAYDPVHNFYIKTNGAEFGGQQPWFSFWDLNSSAPGSSNPNIHATLAANNFPAGYADHGQYGFEYDHVRNQFLLWDGVGQVLTLSVVLPANCNPANDTTNCTSDTSNWVLKDLSATPAPGNTVPTNAMPPNVTYNGVMGKWHYARNLDVFVALDMTANVWFYKPNGWVLPGDLNYDGKVNTMDQIIIIQSLGKKAGNPGFIVKADYDYDGQVTLRDFQIWNKYNTNLN